MRVERVNMAPSQFNDCINKRKESRRKNGYKSRDSRVRAIDFVTILEAEKHKDVDVTLRDYGFDPMICRNIARERMIG